MEVNLELEAQVKALIKENKKVEAVALVQKVMVCGLVNAKRYVDSLNVQQLAAQGGHAKVVQLDTEAGKKVCLWCVSQASLRKTASLHALKHALHTDDQLKELSCSDKLHSMKSVSEYSAYLAAHKPHLHFTPVAGYPLLATAVPGIFLIS